MFSMIMPALARARSPELLELAEGPTRRFAPRHAGAEPGRAEPPEVTGSAIGHYIAQVGVTLETLEGSFSVVSTRFFQANTSTHLKALAEIYTIHPFAPHSNRNFLSKMLLKFAKFSNKKAKFCYKVS